MATQRPMSPRGDYSPPPVDGDFYRITNVLDAKERVIVKRVRDFMESEVAPIIEDYWARDKFPFEIVPKIAKLDIAGSGTRATVPPAAAGC